MRVLTIWYRLYHLVYMIYLSWPKFLNRPKVRWRVTWRPFFCTNAFRIISRFYAIQFCYQYRWITQHKCRKPYHKTNLNRCWTLQFNSHRMRPVQIFSLELEMTYNYWKFCFTSFSFQFLNNFWVWRRQNSYWTINWKNC